MMLANKLLYIKKAYNLTYNDLQRMIGISIPTIWKILKDEKVGKISEMKARIFCDTFDN